MSSHSQDFDVRYQHLIQVFRENESEAFAKELDGQLTKVYRNRDEQLNQIEIERQNTRKSVDVNFKDLNSILEKAEMLLSRNKITPLLNTESNIDVGADSEIKENLTDIIPRMTQEFRLLEGLVGEFTQGRRIYFQGEMGLRFKRYAPPMIIGSVIVVILIIIALFPDITNAADRGIYVRCRLQTLAPASILQGLGIITATYAPVAQTNFDSFGNSSQSLQLAPNNYWLTPISSRLPQIQPTSIPGYIVKPTSVFQPIIIDPYPYAPLVLATTVPQASLGC
jgi:hypothetical protein